MSSADTIFALATPPGKSGVAVVRLSGRQALPALRKLSGLELIAPRRAYYATLRSPAGDVIDRGLVLYFKAPHSFTGEDVTELQLHGSLAVIRELLSVLAQMHGLRPAEPGEFSRRAFMNGKMDLMEAEGLADLIDAETRQQKTQAMRQMQGELSGYYEALREKVTQALAHLEAYIDFPDEDIPASVLTGLEGEIKTIRSLISGVLHDRQRGERLRDGINVVILGAPNAGKSSLLNALAGRDAAIVSARAGTTRDIIEVHMDMGGWPVVLVDTAGLRDSGDDIEEEGVRRALARAEAADVTLVVFDGSLPEPDLRSLALVDGRAMLVVNKSDNLILDTKRLPSGTVFTISAKTGEGINALLAAMQQRIVSAFAEQEAPMITRNRHRALLSEASRHLEKSLTNAPLELTCEELRRAAMAVGKITGKIQVDDVLEVIFRQFCIGK